MNRRRRNTTLSLTVLVQCPNGLRCGKKWRGFVFKNMIAGPQRIILYPEKGEINITAGAILYYLLIHHRSYTSAYGPIWSLWATKGYLGAIQQIYRHLVLYSLLLHQPFFRLSWGTKLELTRFWWVLLKYPAGRTLCLMWCNRAPIWRTTLCSALAPLLCPPHQIT